MSFVGRCVDEVGAEVSRGGASKVRRQHAA